MYVRTHVRMNRCKCKSVSKEVSQSIHIQARARAAEMQAQSPERAKAILRKCDGADASRVLARRNMHKTAWSKLMDAADIVVGRLECTLPLLTMACLSKRWGTDKAQQKDWSEYGDTMALGLQIQGLFNHEKPHFGCSEPDEDSTEEEWNYYKAQWQKAGFCSPVFVLFDQIDAQEHQVDILSWSRTLLTKFPPSRVAELHPDICQAVRPALQLAYCVQALVSPIPMAFGSTAENVWYCIGEPKGGK